MKPGGGVFANFQTGANITNSSHRFKNGKSVGKPNLSVHLCRLATIPATFLRLLHSTEIVAFPRNY